MNKWINTHIPNTILKNVAVRCCQITPDLWHMYELRAFKDPAQSLQTKGCSFLYWINTSYVKPTSFSTDSKFSLHDWLEFYWQNCMVIKLMSSSATGIHLSFELSYTYSSGSKADDTIRLDACGVTYQDFYSLSLSMSLVLMGYVQNTKASVWSF